jgi:hypothetical protein
VCERTFPCCICVYIVSVACYVCACEHALLQVLVWVGEVGERGKEKEDLIVFKDIIGGRKPRNEGQEPIC